MWVDLFLVTIEFTVGLGVANQEFYTQNSVLNDALILDEEFELVKLFYTHYFCACFYAKSSL